MNVLMLHNYYRHRGGEGVSFAAEVEALRALGHEVDTFFVDNVEELGQQNALQLAVNTIWSRKSYRTVRELLQKKAYDILHVQNFFPVLSPSVYDAARDAGVPVVQALRNYRLFCMQTGLFRDGGICEACSNGKHSWAGIRHRCYRGSLPASLTVSAMQEIHRIRGTWKNRVDAYVAVSSCVKDKYVSNGWKPDRIFVKHNTVSPIPEPGNGEGGFFVVAGRLSEDKGLPVLLEAWKKLTAENDMVPGLVIIGDGPLEQNIANTIEHSRLTGHVRMMGRLLLSETYELIGRAAATIVPSVRFEPCSRTIAESYAKGTPVIAANIGGAVELVDDGRSGFKFMPGDAAALAVAVMQIVANSKMANEMRANARLKFDNEFAPSVNARQLEAIYGTVIERRRLV
ncbi:glycosyltransferase family 4 protein [Pontiellaceae bacterium B1224]|nr:glycosyltransferase family 4 protein [Pontiellaceae bacterium B1224]